MFRKRSFEWPSVRRFLLRVHQDLLTIHRSAVLFDNVRELSVAEEMILVLEDRRFLRHFGIDLFSVARELCRTLLRQKHGGASTIDMQWVRTATGYKELSLRRKVYEMFLALLIQQRYDKLTILRSYLASAYFGYKIKGIERASLVVFLRTSRELDFNEAATIASMLVYPWPSVPTPRWALQLERRKRYAEFLHPRHEKRFKKLPRREVP